MKKTLILLTLCFMAIATGCAQQIQKFPTGILGEWESLGTDMPACHVTFKKNGECTTRYFYGNGTDSLVERYSIDGQKIKLFLLVEDFGKKKIYSPDDTDFVEFEFELSGDTLIIKNRVYKKTVIFGEQTKMEYMDAVYARVEQPSKTFDEGVIINGVRWATRNVAAPGTFADKPEDAGMFYQWNRKKAWNATDSIVAGWDNTIPKGTEWEKVNNPSPKGWRIPTMEEFTSLCNEDKVNIEWATQNCVKGMKFTDKTSGNSIFLPAAGYRFFDDGHISYVISGFYWSSTIHEEYNTVAYHLFFMKGEIQSGWTSATDAARFDCGYSLRCVAE